MTLQEAFSKDKFDFSKFTQFTDGEVKWLEDRIYFGTDKNGEPKPKTTCIIRESEIDLNAEEVVRQLYTHKLIEEYNYPKERIEFEKIVQMGRADDKRADIVIYEDEHKTAPYIVVECKAPGKQKIKGQLENYTKNL